MAGNSITILSGATATGAGAAVPSDTTPGLKSVMATVTGTGAVTATVLIEVSADGVTWVSDPVLTITLSGTTTKSGGGQFDGNWTYRANVSAISGTGAAVTVKVVS